MPRHQIFYILLPQFFVGFLFSLSYLFGIYKKSKVADRGALLINMIISVSFLSFLGSVFVCTKDFSHFPVTILSFLGFSGIFLLSKKADQVDYKKSYTSLFYVLISSLVISMFFFVLDYGDSPNTLQLESGIDYTKDIPDTQFPYYEGDYLLPLNSSLRYMSGNHDHFSQKILHIYNVTDRTPALNLCLIPVFIMLGKNVFVYQMVGAVLSSIYLIPLYYLVTILLKKPSQRRMVLLMSSFSHFFLFVSVFGPSKTFSLFYILSGLYFLFKYLRESRNVDLFLISLLFFQAYMSHQFSIIYLLSSLAVLYLFTRPNLRGSTFRKIFLVLLPTLFGVIIWRFYVSSLGLNNTVYNNVMFSNEWANAGKSIKSGEALETKVLFANVFSKQYLKNKILNFIGYFIMTPMKGYSKHFGFRKVTLPGVLGYIVSIGILVSFSWRLIKENIVLLFLVSLFLILPVLYNGFYIEMGLLWYAIGCVPLLYVLFFKSMESLGIPTKYQIRLGILVILEYLYAIVMDTRTRFMEKLDGLFSYGNYVPILIGFLCIALVLYFVSRNGVENENRRKLSV